MPLAMVNVGEVVSIMRVGGREEIKRRLESMEFVLGTHIMVISVSNGNVIAGTKESRVATSKEMANKITV